ncbi:MAG: hypothetical protein HFG73_02940 [Hungatella sp.]|nr:hypothetical protein [Hungatella sp.]
MAGRITGFILWTAMGLLFIGNGLRCFNAKKPTGFWANGATAAVEDVKSYNRAMGKLWCLYGFVLILLGIPLLFERGPWIMVSVIGAMAESIAVMAVYTTKIEKKYRKK